MIMEIKDLFSNLQALFHDGGVNLKTFALAVGVLIGFILLIHGFQRLRRHGARDMMHRHEPLGMTLMHLVAGTILVSLTVFNEMFTATIFGSDYLDKLYELYNYDDGAKYTIDSASIVGEESLQPLIVNILYIIGVIAMIRGVTLLVKIGEGHDDRVAQAIAYIVSAVAAMNAPIIIAAIENFT